MPEAATVNEAVIYQLAKDIHATASDKGFWEPPDPYLAELNTKLMLIVSEVSEAQEVLRNKYTDSSVHPFTRCTERQGAEFLEEITDIIIRAFDLAFHFAGDDVGGTLLGKLEKNSGRPHRHGKRF